MDLFQQDFVLESVVFEKANELIDLLNDGCKDKGRYWATGIFKYKDYFIFRANKKGEMAVYNILDSEGKIPKNMDVNWRIWSIIQHNLNQL